MIAFPSSRIYPAAKLPSVQHSKSVDSVKVRVVPFLRLSLSSVKKGFMSNPEAQVEYNT